MLCGTMPTLFAHHNDQAYLDVVVITSSVVVACGKLPLDLRQHASALHALGMLCLVACSICACGCVGVLCTFASRTAHMSAWAPPQTPYIIDDIASW